METDLFSNDLNNVGYIGNTLYSSLYMTRCRNFRYAWPHNNVFNTSKNCDLLIDDILRQQVGINRTFAYENSCDDLERILELFLKRHKRTNYKLLLRKSRSNEPLKMQATSRRVVREYLHRLIFNVIPSSLFGSKENALIFERNLRKILFLGKSQGFSLDMVVRNIRLRKLSYLRSIDYFINKSNLMAKLYVWLVKVYIFGALKCVFYITETNSSSKYSFYEKRIWQRIQARGLKRVKRKVLAVYKNCILSSAYRIKNLFSLKILPKRQGKIGDKNGILLPLQRKSYCMPSLDRTSKMYTPRTKHSMKVGSGFSQCGKNARDRSSISFVLISWMPLEVLSMLDKLIELISRLEKEKVDFTRFCFEYRGSFRKVEVKPIFEILKDAVLHFVFKDNKNIYKLTQGICQGGSLSSVLCNLYIGEMSLLCMGEFADDEQGFFSRNCDDYLYLTFEKDKAVGFLNLVKKGFPDFNLKVNDSKTKTNLLNSSQTLVSFGNYRIDVESLQLYGCYQSLQGVSIFHKSKIPTVCAPGKLLVERLLTTCCHKLDYVFFDSTYNSIQTMMFNVFMAAVLSAARCFAYVRRLFIRYNYAFIFKRLRRCAKKMTHVVLQNKSFASVKGVTEDTVQWIVLKGFLVRLQAMRLNWLTPIGKRICDSMKVLHLMLEENEREVIKPFYHLKQPDVFRSVT